MAVMTSAPILQHQIGRIGFHDFDISGLMESGGIIEEELPQIVEDKIFVAVGKNVKESRSTLFWALKNSRGKKICILHVHQPAQKIPFCGIFPADIVAEDEVWAYRELEKKTMHDILNDYLLICFQSGVKAEIIDLEMDNIEKGIVKLIAKHGIKKLVMGAAANKHYKKRMTELKSTKAIFVRQNAPIFCHIWFVCREHIIYTREGSLEGNAIQASTPSPPVSPVSVVGHLEHLTPRSLERAKSHHVRLTNQVQDLLRRVRTFNNGSSRGSVEGSTYKKEMKERKEMEEGVSKEKQEWKKMNSQRAQVVEEVRIGLEQNSVLENHTVDSDGMGTELKRIISDVQVLKKKQDELQMERDNAVREAEELMKSQRLQFSEFSILEIEEATRGFHPSMKIGEGGYGNVYKGLLRHTLVAIKILHSQSSQGLSEFQQEVEVLSRVRHPNLVTLIGACLEAGSLIYDYLPNGSLQDRLACKGNTPPLSWQTRIRIAIEICSALIFLHSNKPHSIVHGDLKPANILLDENFISKIGDFGICRSIPLDKNSTNITTLCHITNPKGTVGYIDPAFVMDGELTVKSDVYSYGIILLQLLTGKPAKNIAEEVQCALDKGKLNMILDASACEWPFKQAKQLAQVALKCSKVNRKSRPDLESEVWKVLEPMGTLSGVTSLVGRGSGNHERPTRGSKWLHIRNREALKLKG